MTKVKDLWNDAEGTIVWREVFKDEETGQWLISVNVGGSTIEPPAFSIARALKSYLAEDIRTEAIVAYQAMARCLHRLANKAMLEAEKLQPTSEFEIPIEKLCIDLMNEKVAEIAKHGGRALTIAEERLAAHLRARGWGEKL
jgi:hypothetical protein